MDTQSNVTSTAELESQLGQIILSIEEVVPQRLDNTEAFWFLRGEGKPSSDRHCRGKHQRARKDEQSHLYITGLI